MGRVYMGRVYMGRVYLGRVYLGRVYLGRVYMGRVYLGRLGLRIDGSIWQENQSCSRMSSCFLASAAKRSLGKLSTT